MYSKEYHRQWNLKNKERLKLLYKARKEANPVLWREKQNAALRKYREKHRDEVNAKARERRIKNPKKVYEYCRKWRLKNLKHCSERQKRWRAKNPEKAKAQLKKSRQKHFVRRREDVARWKKKNPERVKILRRREIIANAYNRWVRVVERRAIQKANTVDSKGIRNLFLKWKLQRCFICYYCSLKFSTDDLHIDHVIPLSKNGEHSVRNLCRSCPQCNLSKNAKMPSSFVVEGQPLLCL